MRFLLGALALLAAAPLGAQAPSLDQLLRAEDARARTPADLATLRAGATAPDAERRRHAVRGLGRLERGDLLDDVARALEDDDPSVRHAAADAVGQAVARGEGAPRARAALLARLAVEADSAVRGQLAENAGRVRADSGDVASTAEALAAQLPLRGAARGLYFLVRQRSARGRLPQEVGRRLQQVATTATLADDVRWAAASARLLAGGASAEDSAALRRDPSGDVRALVATAAMTGDPAPIVRYRALAAAPCPALVAATRDTNAHVANGALDALARCANDAGAVEALESSRAARALVPLAAIAPSRAQARLASAARAADPFARTWAARAARRLADTTTLRRLARDADANVVAEAVEGLAGLTGHADDALYVAALRRDVAQVTMAAARALGTGRERAALVAALDRATARRRETSRDARLALVEALGDAVPARYARDFDPVIAARAAALLGVPAAPQPLPPRPVPTVAQLRALRGATIVMADGGRVELRLFPMDAPTNAWRFARLARAGFFDGRTFHRVEPFFVVQGGSPHANEYEGDGPFTRDEVGRENRRGTVGVSTRGRDTGDGQLYVNTVDNVRLDHDYTVFAEVVSGMDVVDRMLEGARIRRVVMR